MWYLLVPVVAVLALAAAGVLLVLLLPGGDRRHAGASGAWPDRARAHEMALWPWLIVALVLLAVAVVVAIRPRPVRDAAVADGAPDPPVRAALRRAAHAGTAALAAAAVLAALELVPVGG
jgi:hypothetical protein